MLDCIEDAIAATAEGSRGVVTTEEEEEEDVLPLPAAEGQVVAQAVIERENSNK